MSAAALFELDKPRRARARKPALFDAYWTTLDGQRIERATRLELRAATRIYWQYRAETT